MRILLKIASKMFEADYEEEIRENVTAQDILNLINEFNEKIIIEKGGTKWNRKEIDENGNWLQDENFDYTITIYDDYVE